MGEVSYNILSDVANYRSERIKTDLLTVSSYISTENMLPEKAGISSASSIPTSNTQCKFYPDDILLSNIRPYFKKIWLSDRTGGCSNDVLVLKANQQINPLFLYYVLSDYNFFQYSTITSKGTKMPRGSKPAIMKYLIPNFSRPVQQKIADILSAYDDLIENNNRRIELLEKSTQELYKEWFVRFRFPDYENTKFVNGLPEGWDYVNFGDVVTVIDGDRGVNYPKQHEFFEEEFCLFLNAGNVTKNGFSFENNSYITEEKDLILRKGKLKKGDIVVTTRGTVGNCAYYTQSVSFEHVRINSGMIILRKNNKLSSGYLYTLLKSTYLKKTIELFSSGSAQPQLPIKDMKHMKILSPSEYVMNTFNDIVEACFDEIALIGTKNQNLKKQRDLLLPRLMSGKLEV